MQTSTCQTVPLQPLLLTVVVVDLDGHKIKLLFNAGLQCIRPNRPGIDFTPNYSLTSLKCN